MTSVYDVIVASDSIDITVTSLLHLLKRSCVDCLDPPCSTRTRRFVICRLPFSAAGQNCPKTQGYKSSQNSSKLPKLNQNVHKNSSKITF